MSHDEQVPQPAEESADEPSVQGPAAPAEEAQEVPVPTSYRRHIWLLVIIFAVVLLAWIVSILQKRLGGAADGMAGRGPDRPVAAPAPPSPGRAPPGRAPRRGPAGGQPAAVSLVVGTERKLVNAAPPLRLEGAGTVYRLPRVFDVTDHVPGFQPRELVRLPGRYADQIKLPRLDELSEAIYRSVDEVQELQDADRILALQANDVVRGYPIGSLARRVGMVDSLPGLQVLVSWSDLSQAARCLTRDAEPPTDWGDAGFTYRGNAVYYDAATGSLWEPLGGRALTGPAAGETAQIPPAWVTTWARFRQEHPEADVLALGLGTAGRAAEERTIALRQAVESYLESPVVPVPLQHFDPTTSPLPAKAFVLGISTDAHARAYPLAALEEAGKTTLRDTVGERPVEVVVTSRRTAHARSEGEPVDAAVMLWFAWKENHPETELYEVEEVGQIGPYQAATPLGPLP